MSNKITVIRHCESLFNAGKIGPFEDLNCKITNFGMQQANSIDFTFDILIISPLKRALETYTNSKIKANKIVINELFEEIHFEVPSFIEAESKEEIEKRVNNAKKFIEDLNYENIGIISHGAFLKYFLKACNQEIKDFKNGESITFYL